MVFINSPDEKEEDNQIAAFGRWAASDCSFVPPVA